MLSFAAVSFTGAMEPLKGKLIASPTLKSGESGLRIFTLKFLDERYFLNNIS